MTTSSPCPLVCPHGPSASLSPNPLPFNKPQSPLGAEHGQDHLRDPSERVEDDKAGEREGERRTEEGARLEETGEMTSEVSFGAGCEAKREGEDLVLQGGASRACCSRHSGERYSLSEKQK